MGPTLANIFLCHYEEQWLKSCPVQFKPIYFKRYVDDIFCLFQNEQQVNKFEKYLNSRHTSMNFSRVNEDNRCLSFLDVLISRHEDKFCTSLYKKPTFSGLYLNFKSFVPLLYKKGLIFCLVFRIYNICSDWNRIHEEIKKLKCLLLKNKYPISFINFCIRFCLNKLIVGQTTVSTVPKKEFSICLPFLGKETLVVKNKLLKLFSSLFPAFKLRIVLKPGIKIGSLLNFKDIIPFGARSFVVYKFSCGNCDITYIGKTTRHLLVRMSEHLGISYKTGKDRKYNIKQTSAIREHLRVCNHKSDVNNFKILASANTDFELLIKESLLVDSEKPLLNKQVKSFQLSLF